MARFTYATLEDMLRLFEVDIEQSDFGNEVTNSDAVLERLRAKVDAANAAFDSATDSAMRETRVGTPGSPATYEYVERKGGEKNRWKSSKLYLDSMKVVPLDSSQGDALEIRTGRDTWRDVTSDEGTRWRANYSKGIIEFLDTYGRGTITLGTHSQHTNREHARITYRTGALGQSERDSGQTTLGAGVTDTETGSVTVADATRLPRGTYYVLVGGTEYVHVTNDNSGLSFDARGERGTDGVSHDSGDVVHYCPLDVREAVASKAAIELLRQDDTLDLLIEANDNLQRNEKIRQLESEWDAVRQRYSTSVGYV